MSEHPPKLAVTVAGNHFRPIDDQVFFQRELDEDCVIRLEREPSNKFDGNAIKILATSPYKYPETDEYEVHFIGYVPARHNTELAQAMDAGMNVEARWNSTTSRVEIWYGSPQNTMDFDGADSVDT